MLLCQNQQEVMMNDQLQPKKTESNILQYNMYHKLQIQKRTQKWQQLIQQRTSLYTKVFQLLNTTYQLHDIQINKQQLLHTIYIPCRNKGSKINFFFSHGFGGSSLMNIGVIEPLLEKGSVILWQIRGMGFSQKLQIYQKSELLQIEQFFLDSISTLIKYYNDKQIVLIGLSLSSYLILRFLTARKQQTEKIKEVLVLSAVGVTPKQQDYKNSIRNCSDIWYTLLNKFGWCFKLTFKSPLRTICACCKTSFLKKYANQLQLQQKQRQIIAQILELLVIWPDGSDKLFFQYFQPRVLPKIALEPLFTEEPKVKITFVYGGQQDWVDKTGAKRLSQKYSNKIQIKEATNCGHTIPLHKKQCIQVFKSIFYEQ